MVWCGEGIGAGCGKKGWGGGEGEGMEGMREQDELVANEGGVVGESEGAGMSSSAGQSGGSSSGKNVLGESKSLFLYYMPHRLS